MNGKPTKEELKLLKNNAKHIITAYKSNYSLPLLQRDLIGLNDIIRAHYGGRGYNLNCSRCILSMLKSLYPMLEENSLIP